MPDEPNEPIYDPAQMLTYAALAFVGVLILFVCAIITAQILKGGEANTESWAALTGAIGWATGVASGLYNNRFGSTAQSAAKDSTIATQARTAAVIAQAVPSPAAPQTAIKTDTVEVDAQSVAVNTAPPLNEEK